MSMLGIAREVAALTGGSVRLPSVEYEELPVHLGERTSVTVDNPGLCPPVIPLPYWTMLQSGLLLPGCSCGCGRRECVPSTMLWM